MCIQVGVYKDRQEMYARDIVILTDVIWTDFKAIFTFLGGSDFNEQVYTW